MREERNSFGRRIDHLLCNLIVSACDVTGARAALFFLYILPRREIKAIQWMFHAWLDPIAAHSSLVVIGEYLGKLFSIVYFC